MQTHTRLPLASANVQSVKSAVSLTSERTILDLERLYTNATPPISLSRSTLSSEIIKMFFCHTVDMYHVKELWSICKLVTDLNDKKICDTTNMIEGDGKCVKDMVQRKVNGMDLSLIVHLFFHRLSEW